MTVVLVTAIVEAARVRNHPLHGRAMADIEFLVAPRQTSGIRFEADVKENGHLETTATCAT